MKRREPHTLLDHRRGTSPRTSPPADVDARALRRDLERTVRGEVRFDDGSRALYATDASNYRQIPIGVVVPKDAADVEAAVAACRAHGAPLLGRGGGTSLAGQCCNVAVVLDFTKYMHKVLSIDPERRLARVQPGCVLDDLRDQAAAHGLTFGPDPATHDRCTLGGMIGNNSCGVHSQMSGRTADYVEELEVVTYDGARFRVGPADAEERAAIIRGGGRRAEIYASLSDLANEHAARIRHAYPDIPRRVSGYNLDELLPEKGFQVARALVGSEGTCALVVEATVRLVPRPTHQVVLLLGFADIAAAADAVPALVEAAAPTGLEAFDDTLVRSMRKKHLHEEHLALLPGGGAYLVVELGADTVEAGRADAERVGAWATEHAGAVDARIFADEAEQMRVWAMRESGLGATARVPGEPDTWPGWEDAAVPPAALGDYLRAFQDLLDTFGYKASLYGHFGQGCVHTRIPFDLKTAGGIERYRAFVERAADLVVAHGGSLSGEHGDGQSRAELLGRMYSPELLDAMRRFKTIWDPRNRMNPGKVVDPHPLDADLRFGVDYHPKEPQTTFRYPDDEGSFVRAAERCVGVGLCRRQEGGLMCPSYMVTREEQHSTRGRARLLHEMLQGDAIRDGWRSEAVKDALDLCLSCKGCKVECPVNVDMATYKAEFLHHYYAGRVRPLAAYVFGNVDIAARLAARASGLVNAAMRTPLGALAKRTVGIPPERELPTFARTTFREWYETRGPRVHSDRRLVLWPDTFTNHFHPEIGKAAVRVLEQAGWEVVLPRRILCCGRPLYEYGMLDRAVRLLRRDLAVMRSEIRSGMPLVGLEPSCTAVFRDELAGLLPHDEDAKRLAAQTYTFAEFLVAHTDLLEQGGWGTEMAATAKAARLAGTTGTAGTAGTTGPAGTAGTAGTATKGPTARIAEPAATATVSTRPPLGPAPVRHRANGNGLPKHGLRTDGNAQRPDARAAVPRTWIVQRHCHHQSIMGFDADQAVLKALGVEHEVLDSGCCGMAGAFGFERSKYAVSMACAERVLLPRVRALGTDGGVLADGFSCRTQVEQATGVRPWHLAELVEKIVVTEADG